MSGGREQSLYFVSLPDLKKLCCLTLSLQQFDDGEVRNKQVKTCRELLLLYPDLLASPTMDSFSEITLVIAIPFYKRGVVQAYVQRHCLQVGPPQRVLPGILQSCLAYSLTTRLSPHWNKAGHYLIAGRDFLTQTGRLIAVVMELNTTENQLCISVEASTVRLPPTRLEDFDIPPMVLRNFYSRPEAVIQTFSRCNNWCFILPSMKRGQVINVSHQLPADSPFQSYTDLCSHWNSLYGYRLPQPAEEEQVVYCSVYFKLLGERLFTYPLSCIRTEPVQRCPRVDLQGALSSFMFDLRDRLKEICGLPVRMTSKPCYHTASLLSPVSSQVTSGKPVNLTTRSSSRPILTQLPAVAARPPRPCFGPDTPVNRPPLGMNHGGVVIERQDAACESGQWQTPRRSQDTSTSSSSSPSLSFPSKSASATGHITPSQYSSSSSGYHSAGSLFSSSSSSLSSSSSSSFHLSSAPSRAPLPVPAAGVSKMASLNTLGPKMVPIFKNKSLTRHVNVTQLLAQKRGDQRRGGEDVQRVSPFGLKRPALSSSAFTPSSSSSSSLSSSKWSQNVTHPSPPSIPRFTHRTKIVGVSSASPQPTSTSRPLQGHVAGISPRSVLLPGASPQPPAPLPTRPMEPADVPSNRGGEWVESKPKRPKPSVQHVDVEKQQNNQLCKVNAATLIAWLRGRGVAVRSKDRKEELVSKVMGSLNEA